MWVQKAGLVILFVYSQVSEMGSHTCWNLGLALCEMYFIHGLLSTPDLSWYLKLEVLPLGYIVPRYSKIDILNPMPNAVRFPSSPGCFSTFVQVVKILVLLNFH